MGNLGHASSIARIDQLPRDDYRGIIVTMIHNFRDMPADLNTPLTSTLSSAKLWATDNSN